MGQSLVSRTPMVFTIRHPPATVSRPIAAWSGENYPNGT